MKTSRIALATGVSATFVAAGFAAAPDSLPSLDLGGPSTPTDPSASPHPSSTAAPTGGATDQPGGTSGTFDGPAVDNIRGTYQLQIVVDAGVVTDVIFLEAGTAAAESVQINAMALPILREEILEAQDWDVEYVSGASFTSPAMVESAQGAFEAAGL